jgi:hypothetical protein
MLLRLVNCCLPAIPTALRWVVSDSGPSSLNAVARWSVSPKGRGFGLGERLVDAVVKEAKRIGYREMRLDTLPSMTGAIALYRKFGFEPIESYYETPVIGTIFMRRSLIERSGQEVRPPTWPEEVGYRVLFLVSDEEWFITGTKLVIGGGFIA